MGTNMSAGGRFRPKLDQPPAGAKRFGVKPKYWAIIVLATIATGVGALYYARQPAPDLGPITVHHKTASSAVKDVKDWKTYKIDEYGFEVQFTSP